MQIVHFALSVHIVYFGSKSLMVFDVAIYLM